MERTLQGNTNLKDPRYSLWDLCVFQQKKDAHFKSIFILGKVFYFTLCTSMNEIYSVSYKDM